MPDPLGVLDADAGHGYAVVGRAVVGDPVDGLGAAALGERVEEVVRRRSGGVVDVEAAERGVPVVAGRPSLEGLSMYRSGVPLPLMSIFWPTR